MKTMCKGPQCKREAIAKGLCVGHYTQVRHGKPLTPLRRYGTSIDVPAGYHFCTQCENIKKESEFYVRRDGGLYSECKPCKSARVRASRQRKAESA